MDTQTHETVRARRLVLRGVLVSALLFALVAAVGTGVAQQPIGPSPAGQDRPLMTLRDLNRAFIDLAAQVKPAVVTVSTERILTMQRRSPFSSPFANDPFFDFFFGPRDNRRQPEEQEYRQEGLGSGVIVSADGYILTNNHVVASADSIYVGLYDGSRHTAEVVGTDPQTDIAVLRIDADNLPFITIGNSDSLQVGEIVLAIGSPMSENLAATVTQGIVSAKGRSNVGLADYEDFIQTDAAINPGNSGGPLVNLDGTLVGLNTAIVSRSGGFQGIGFAVPSNMAMRVMNSLISEGRVVRGWLGVSIQDVDETIAQAMKLPQTTGALVGDVSEDSPAAKAGLEAGDLITSVDGREIRNSSQLRNQIAATPPGSSVRLGVIRNDRAITLTVTLGELPSELARGGVTTDIEDMLGFSVQTMSNDLARRYNIDQRATGVVVTSLDPQSPAYEAGLREGDLIRSVERQRVQSSDQFYTVINEKKRGDSVLLRVIRGGNAFFLAFALR
ncbi:MAG: DegQ family serine endoprotease [candidate division Zixibacteria bacterium]|jgi:serine protease Do|nr:DegQ family serine endoprotease [candidate division Zixibacteria bacterium]